MKQHFTARIYKLGINPCVDVPLRVGQAFGRRGYVSVTGALNGHPLRATLAPKGGGLYRLFINGEMRKRVRAAFEQLQPSRRKESLTYLNWVKRPETLKRNIGKVIAALLKK